MLGLMIVRLQYLFLLTVAAFVAMGAVHVTDLGPPRFHPTFARHTRIERAC